MRFLFHRHRPEILERLDRIIALLEYQTFGPSGPQECLHRNVQDIGRMGQKPGSVGRCKDCGAILKAK